MRWVVCAEWATSFSLFAGRYISIYTCTQNEEEEGFRFYSRVAGVRTAHYSMHFKTVAGARPQHEGRCCVGGSAAAAAVVCGSSLVCDIFHYVLARWTHPISGPVVVCEKFNLRGATIFESTRWYSSTQHYWWNNTVLQGFCGFLTFARIGLCDSVPIPPCVLTYYSIYDVSIFFYLISMAVCRELNIT